MSPSPRPGSTTGARFGLTSEVQQLTCVLFVLVCAVSRPVGASAPLIATPSPYLPPLLTFENGTDVSDEAGWRQRRLEVSRLAQEAFLGTYPADVPPLISHTVLNVTEAGEGVSCTFVELTFDTSRGGGSVPTVTLPLEIIAPTDAISRPVFLTQWNHRQWALEGVARGYIGVVYPGSDAKDVAPLFQRAYPNSTFALITARAFVGSRCLDFVLAHWPNVNSDQVALTGHSRNGKQSLVFAALDERVTATVGSSPGVPIASPYHFSSENYYGESPRTGGVTCRGPQWWLCSSLEYDGHPERMPMDGHGILGLCAPRACAIATAHQDSCDYTFANEMSVKEALKVYRLLGKEENVRLIYRYGQHHGLDDITTYFDWFDKAFGIKTGYAAALASEHKLTADSELIFPMTWLTPAGFDWELWNTSSKFGRDPPGSRTDSMLGSGSDRITVSLTRERVRWMLALGAIPSGDSEESEGSSYIPGMMYHELSSTELEQQPFAFGDYLSGTAVWSAANLTAAGTKDKPAPLVIWLHPYSYNTGYSPQYGQANIREALARSGNVVMAFDQVGFGIRVTQGGNKFYARHGGHASLLGQMVKDVRAAVDFMRCRSTLRHNATLCSQHGYATSNAAIDRIPYVDLDRIYLAGFALGGTVALHAAALDSENYIAGVASFAGFTPMRTDTPDKPTGGIRRLYEMHALIPRLGLFQHEQSRIPYDYDDLLTAIAPRPTLLYTPQSDRDATYTDVAECVSKVSSQWPAGKLTHTAPNTTSKMEAPEEAAIVAWFKSL